MDHLSHIDAPVLPQRRTESFAGIDLGGDDCDDDDSDSDSDSDPDDVCSNSDSDDSDDSDSDSDLFDLQLLQTAYTPSQSLSISDFDFSDDDEEDYELDSADSLYSSANMHRFSAHEVAADIDDEADDNLSPLVRVDSQGVSPHTLIPDSELPAFSEDMDEHPLSLPRLSRSPSASSSDDEDEHSFQPSPPPAVYTTSPHVQFAAANTKHYSGMSFSEMRASSPASTAALAMRLVM